MRMEREPFSIPEAERVATSEEAQVKQYEAIILRELPHMNMRSEQEIVDFFVIGKRAEHKMDWGEQVVEGHRIRKALLSLVEQRKIIERDGQYEISNAGS